MSAMAFRHFQCRSGRRLGGPGGSAMRRGRAV
jgi:hypothetical protein